MTWLTDEQRASLQTVFELGGVADGKVPVMRLEDEGDFLACAFLLSHLNLAAGGVARTGSTSRQIVGLEVSPLPRERPLPPPEISQNDNPQNHAKRQRTRTTRQTRRRPR